LFTGTVKRFADDFDAEQYHAFWTEFDQILADRGTLPNRPLQPASGAQPGVE
jgi:hypothetical protein